MNTHHQNNSHYETSLEEYFKSQTWGDLEMWKYVFEGFCLCDLTTHTEGYKTLNVLNTECGTRDSLVIKTKDFSSHIQRLHAQLEALPSLSSYFTTPKKKSEACARKAVSKRRTKYVGVTRNSVNYQTLIVIDKKKVYVGSFPEEKHAAITYDFYCLLLNGHKARTNFRYTVSQVLTMLEVYSCNNAFDPREFAK